jgi:hypothetical protein
VEDGSLQKEIQGLMSEAETAMEDQRSLRMELQEKDKDQ